MYASRYKRYYRSSNKGYKMSTRLQNFKIKQLKKKICSLEVENNKLKKDLRKWRQKNTYSTGTRKTYSMRN